MEVGESRGEAVGTSPESRLIADLPCAAVTGQLQRPTDPQAEGCRVQTCPTRPLGDECLRPQLGLDEPLVDEGHGRYGDPVRLHLEVEVGNGL